MPFLCSHSDSFWTVAAFQSFSQSFSAFFSPLMHKFWWFCENECGVFSVLSFGNQACASSRGFLAWCLFKSLNRKPLVRVTAEDQNSAFPFVTVNHVALEFGSCMFLFQQCFGFSLLCLEVSQHWILMDLIESCRDDVFVGRHDFSIDFWTVSEE